MVMHASKRACALSLSSSRSTAAKYSSTRSISNFCKTASMWACVSTNVLSDDDDDDGRARDDDVDAIALDITLDARTTRADESADMRGKVTMDRSSLSRVS